MFEVEVTGNAATVERQCDLDEAGNPGAGFQVADVRLHRADHTGFFARPSV